MLHLIIFFSCILSVEIFTRTKFLKHLNSVILSIKKITLLIFNKKISDHWKEKVIPVYSFIMMIASIKMLLILILIISNFLLFEYLYVGVLNFLLSIIGILESLLIVYVYIKARIWISNRLSHT